MVSAGGNTLWMFGGINSNDDVLAVSIPDTKCW